MQLTHFLGHLLHDVAGDVSDGCVAQTFNRVLLLLQLFCADPFIMNVRVQLTDEYQKTQQEQW